MEQRKEPEVVKKELFDVEHCYIEVWTLYIQSMRQNKPWTYTKTIRKCNYLLAGGIPCGKEFTNKSNSDKHVHTHEKMRT